MWRMSDKKRIAHVGELFSDPGSEDSLPNMIEITAYQSSYSPSNATLT